MKDQLGPLRLPRNRYLHWLYRLRSHFRSDDKALGDWHRRWRRLRVSIPAPGRKNIMI